MVEKIIQQSSPESSAPVNATPDMSNEAQNVETAAEQVVAAVDTAATAFEREQQQLLESTEREASAGPTSVTPEELAEIKQKSGIAKTLQNIGDRVREMHDHLKEAAMDRKIEKFVKKHWHDPSTGMSFSDPEVQNFVADLTLDQVKRNPQIIKAMEQNLLWHYKEMAERSAITVINGDYDKKGEPSFHLKGLQGVMQAIQNKSELKTTLLDQPEIITLQKEIFKKCLYELISQPYANKLADLLFMNHDQARAMVIDALADTMVNLGSSRSRVYYVAKACEDFQLDQEAKFNLAVMRFETIMANSYPYIGSSYLQSDFNFTNEDIDEFIAAHHTRIEKAAYQASFRLLKDNAVGVKNFWEHLKSSFRLSLTIDGMKGQPEAQEQIKEAVLSNAKLGHFDHQLNYDFLESLSSQPLEAILDTPEGKDALYFGAADLIQKGRNVDYLNGYLKRFHLDVASLKQHPTSREAIKEMIHSSLNRNSNFWPNEMIKFLDIPESEIHDLKILMIINLLGQKGEFWRAMYLLESTTVSPEEQRQISQKVFEADDKFPYLLKLNDLYETYRSQYGSTIPGKIMDNLLREHQEQVDDMKSLLIVNFINTQEYSSALKIINDTDFSPSDQKSISQKVFSVDNMFPYLLRLKNLGPALTNVPKIFLTRLIQEFERFNRLTDAQIQSHLDMIERINTSPSQEMVRIKDQLIEQIIMTDNPEQTYKIIQDIFIQNNIPLVGKIQRIFDALFPDDRLANVLSNHSSPVLLHASARARQFIIFQDLLKVHINSSNRSLKTFLQLFQQGEPLLSKLDSQQELSTAEQQKLAYILKKLKTLVDVSQRGQKAQFGPVETSSLNTAYQELRQQLGIKPEQLISERIVEMFARPLGYSNVSEVLATMTTAKAVADRRSRQNANQDWGLKNGDLVKGVSLDYIDNILQNGSVAKEFLGASSTSDSTPLDTDIEMIGESGEIKIASRFGKVLFVIKNRGQFQSTSPKDIAAAKYDPNKYELFYAGIMTDEKAQHYGIRTGFPCTEIDFMMLNGVDNQETIEGLFYSIAQNGYYIPVVDKEKKLIFTPQMYDEYRKWFAGIERFDGSDMPFTSSKTESYYPEIRSILDSKQQDAARLFELKTDVRTMILQVLAQFDIKLKPEYDDSLLGAELLDIGSTGRGTNTVGEGDFDLSLKLDAQDFDKVPAIAQEIEKRLGNERRESPILPSESNRNQFRFFGTNVFNQKNVDIDIGFVRKSDLNVYASHDALADKLNNIRQKHGEEAYQEVIANVLLAKKWLKEGEAYKKGDWSQGGLGGVGVENLILAYGGNIKTAFKAFTEAAKNPDGSIKNLEEFKKTFKLLDAGLDLRANRHDNFVYNMNEQGYQKMLQVIKEHFGNI
jgi:hypothetical protein